jgi:hypothetical protein
MCGIDRHRDGVVGSEHRGRFSEVATESWEPEDFDLARWETTGGGRC